MIKLSIILPSGAQVALESDDKDFVREVLYSAIPHLNGTVATPAVAPNVASPESSAHSNGHELTRSTASRPGNGHHPPTAETSSEPDDLPRQPVPSVGASPLATHQAVESEPAVSTPVEPDTAAVVQTTYNAPAPVVSPSTPDEHEFIAFCQRVNPLGDMRRVVVAAEAADRHLAVKSVDPDELSRLFTLAGWPIPHSFVQTLRNAARSKFRWMERIAGQLGHYRVTSAGRKIVLGENATSSPTPSDSNA